MIRGYEPVIDFSQWYVEKDVDSRDGTLVFRGMAPCADHMWQRFNRYKREMDIRVANYEKLEKLAAGEVISPKPDLPNISSGELAGLVRRLARSLVQNTPNVEVVSQFDDDSVEGIFSRHILTAKIIGTDEYSNDMQQNLLASVKGSLTKGFDCVIPVLLQDAGGSWYMKYDTIHYRDVFPEPGAKDVRQATDVFIRRYLTEGEVAALIRDEVPGWDIDALRLLAKNRPPSREQQSVDHQTKKTGQIPYGYEIITWYSSSGEPFLTFSANTKVLLRIEQNKHPLRHHPVHFLVLEKDDQQPLGKSLVELALGRQEFQDLMFNGAMKLWYRNINPSIIGYGTVNAIPNLSPGKYTQISNPNAKIMPFEVNTQTLMQYGQISQQNLGSMVNLVGAPDQQMGQAAGNGMSATPQGVDAQNAVVDVTTNDYQKAIESFFSHYCSYALTIYFQEMKAIKAVTPTAEAKMRLMKAGLEPEDFNEQGQLEIDFEKLATEYWVRCVPGSLTELEDEKQLRILNQLFIPLSQAMPALANAGDPEALAHASAAMRYIVQKEIELSGSSSSRQLTDLLTGKKDSEQVDERDERIAQLEKVAGGLSDQVETELDLNSKALVQLQQQMSLLMQSHTTLLQKLGVLNEESPTTTPESTEGVVDNSGMSPTVMPASA